MVQVGRERAWNRYSVPSTSQQNMCNSCTRWRNNHCFPVTTVIDYTVSLRNVHNLKLIVTKVYHTPKHQLNHVQNSLPESAPRKITHGAFMVFSMLCFVFWNKWQSYNSIFLISDSSYWPLVYIWTLVCFVSNIIQLGSWHIYLNKKEY